MQARGQLDRLAAFVASASAPAAQGNAEKQSGSSKTVASAGDKKRPAEETTARFKKQKSTK